MKNIFVGIFILLTTVALFAGGEQEASSNRNSATRYGAIELEMDVHDELSVTGIDAINTYDMENYLLGKIEDLFDDFEKKYYLEFHIGAKYNVLTDMYLKVDEVQDGVFEEVPIKISPEVLIKLNLFNPKIYNSNILLNKILIIREIVTYYKIDLSPETWVKVNYIENYLKKYEEQMFFKRISVGIGLPFELNPEENYQDNLVIDKMNIFLGYDVMDIVTINLGYNIVTFDEIYLGASFDISTPVINASDVFSDYVKKLLRI